MKWKCFLFAAGSIPLSDSDTKNTNKATSHRKFHKNETSFSPLPHYSGCLHSCSLRRERSPIGWRTPGQPAESGRLHSIHLSRQEHLWWGKVRRESASHGGIRKSTFENNFDIIRTLAQSAVESPVLVYDAHGIAKHFFRWEEQQQISKISKIVAIFP